MLSMSGYTLMMIFDRVCLAAYSEETLAASGPAVFTAMILISFFKGLIFATQPKLVFAFEARDGGQKLEEEVSRTIALALISSLLLGILAPVLVIFSTFSGRPDPILEIESIYIHWSIAFGAVMILNTVGTCYFSATGKTKEVLKINSAGQVVSMFMTWVLVFGELGFPELGVTGSALGTLAGAFLILVLYVKSMSAGFFAMFIKTLKSYVRWPQFQIGKSLRYGAPVGANESADELGNTAIMWAIGLMGQISLAANSFNIILNYFSVVPIVGLGEGANVLTARAIANDKHRQVPLIMWTTVGLALIYSIVIALLLRIFGESLTVFLGVSDYGTEVFSLSLIITDVIFLYAFAFSLSYTACRVLQAYGLNRFVLTTRLIIMWGMSIPAAFLIAISNSFEGHKLLTIWVSLSLFELMIGVVASIRAVSLSRRFQ